MPAVLHLANVMIGDEPHSEDYTDYRTSANVHCVLFREEQAAYLAGYAAVREGNTSKMCIRDRHNSKCRYGERGAAAAKPNAQIILDVLSSILATQMPCRSRRRGA